MNSLEGKIPDCVGKLAALHHFDAHRNKISGTIPGALSSLTRLKTLDLSENKLRGSIPEALGSLDLDVINLVKNPRLSPPRPDGPLQGKLSRKRLKAGRNRMN